ncbi:MAG: methyltransferase domain-containing protein, partial [Pseudorhodoplanes sp.]
MRFESLPFRPYISTLLFGMRVAKSFFGKFPRECTICGYKGRFLAFANPLHLGVNIDSRCPNCISIERHRLVALADRKHDFFGGKELLHFAPELGMRAYIKKRNPKRYVTCDYSEPGVDLKIDVMDIDLPDNSFDVVYCSHVLEHVDEAR